jgi:hypothetical protein
VCRHCPYGWEKVHYRDDKGKLMRKIPRVRCGDQAGAEKLLSKIDTVDYFAKKEEYYDDNETDDERRGRMQFVIASITRMQSDREYV